MGQSTKGDGVKPGDLIPVVLMPGDTIPISVVVGAHELDPGLEVTVTVDGDPIALDELGNGVFEASVTPGEEGKLDLLASLTATLKSKVGLAKDRATAPYSDQVSLGLLVGFREVDFHLTSKFADPRLCPGDSLDLKGWATPRHDPSTVDRIEETSLRLAGC